LSLPLEQIVPVLQGAGTRHLQSRKGIIPLIHEELNEAQRVRYLHCLRHQQDISYWKH